MEYINRHGLVPKISIISSVALGILIFSLNTSACACASGIMGYQGQSGINGAFSPFSPMSGIPVFSSSFRMTSSGGWNGESATAVTEYVYHNGEYIEQVTLTAPRISPLVFNGFMNFWSSAGAAGSSYFTNTPRGNALKKQCEAQGKKWISVWAQDINGKFGQQTGCVSISTTDDVSARACKLAAGATAVAGRKQIAAVCKMPGGPWLCFGVAALVDAACEDGPIEDQLPF